MILSSGDLAQTLALRSANARLSSQLETAAQTVADGKIQDLSAALGGDFRPLNAIQNALTKIEAFQTSTSEAAFFFDQQQTALGALSDIATSVGTDFVAADNSDATQTLATLTSVATSGFEQAVGYLNSTAAGRAIFSGAAVEDAPLPSAEDLLTAVSDAISTATSTAEAQDMIRTFFMDTAGGFETAQYQGSTTDGPSFRVDTDTKITSDLSALTPEIREVLSNLATAALVPDVDSMTDTGSALLGNAGDLAELSGVLGTTQARLETLEVTHSATTTSLELRHTDMTTPDMYEAATELENYEQALERLYLVTSRLSALSFAEYM